MFQNSFFNPTYEKYEFLDQMTIYSVFGILGAITVDIPVTFQSLGHSVTRSLGHSVTRSLGHLITWSTCIKHHIEGMEHREEVL